MSRWTIWNLPAPAFVKIDVEWQEAAALRGMQRMLARRTPMLACRPPTAARSAARRDDLGASLDYRVELSQWTLSRPPAIASPFRCSSTREIRLVFVLAIFDRSSSMASTGESGVSTF